MPYSADKKTKFIGMYEAYFGAFPASSKPESAHVWYSFIESVDESQFKPMMDLLKEDKERKSKPYLPAFEDALFTIIKQQKYKGYGKACGMCESGGWVDFRRDGVLYNIPCRCSNGAPHGRCSDQIWDEAIERRKSESVENQATQALIDKHGTLGALNMILDGKTGPLVEDLKWFKLNEDKVPF